MVTVTPPEQADSYATLLQADLHHELLGHTEWEEADDVAKETALRRATRWLDATYGPRWPGQRVKPRDQLLDWPRVNAEDYQGWYINHETIPKEVVNATIEAALRELRNPGSLQPDVTPGTQKTMIRAGDIAWQPGVAPGVNEMKPVLTVVDGILFPLIGGSNLNNRLVRA